MIPVERRLAEDGFEAMGSFGIDDAIAVGDPARLAASAAFGADGFGNAWELAACTGEWRLWLQSDPESDRVIELLAVGPDAMGDVYEAYDAAALVAEIGTPSGRIVLVEAARRDDAALLKSFLEPDELPWLVDDGVVAAAGEFGHVRVLATMNQGKVTLISVHLGPYVASTAGASPIDSDERD